MWVIEPHQTLTLRPPSGQRSDASRRRRIQEPQCTLKPQVQGLHRRPEAKDDAIDQTRDETQRRATVEPVIGHIKNEHRKDRNYLVHSSSDAINAVLAAADYNFRLLLNWLRLLLHLCLAALFA